MCSCASPTQAQILPTGANTVGTLTCPVTTASLQREEASMAVARKKRLKGKNHRIDFTLIWQLGQKNAFTGTSTLAAAENG